MYLTKTKNRLSTNIFLVSIILTFMLFQSCSKSDNPASSNNNPGTNEVLLQNFAFSPASKTVAVGTTIKWTNKDNATHTVTSGAPGSPTSLFDSGDLGQNGEFSFTFSQVGTFPYFCKHHSNMIGTIIVQ
jgi:plastocyanin